IKPGEATTIRLKLNRRVGPRDKSVDTPTMQSVKFRSDCLSKFHGRDIYLQAVLSLPDDDLPQPNHPFPATYRLPGFGGEHFEPAVYAAAMIGKPRGPFVKISLDATCPLGHPTFADSANNGPYGRALTTEFIPWLEKKFRLRAEPSSRFLTGHSSGGWTT